LGQYRGDIREQKEGESTSMRISVREKKKQISFEKKQRAGMTLEGDLWFNGMLLKVFVQSSVYEPG
jgi:hypothetical protein